MVTPHLPCSLTLSGCHDCPAAGLQCTLGMWMTDSLLTGPYIKRNYTWSASSVLDLTYVIKTWTSSPRLCAYEMRFSETWQGVNVFCMWKGLTVTEGQRVDEPHNMKRPREEEQGPLWQPHSFWRTTGKTCQPHKRANTKVHPPASAVALQLTPCHTHSPNCIIMSRQAIVVLTQ